MAYQIGRDTQLLKVGYELINKITISIFPVMGKAGAQIEGCTFLYSDSAD